MKPYIVLFFAPTTHDNPRLPFKILPSGKKQAAVYYECLADALASISEECIMDSSLSIMLVQATPSNVQKYLGE